MYAACVMRSGKSYGLNWDIPETQFTPKVNFERGLVSFGTYLQTLI